MYYYGERLVSLAIYCLILVIVFWIIESTKISHRRILFCYAICLSIMGYAFMPTENLDLYRINKIMLEYAEYDFKGLYENVLKGSYIICADLLYWVIGKTGRLALLPAITAFISYSCIFYTINRTAEMYKIDRRNVAIAILFLMAVGTYIFVISGIRTMLGISLLVFCFFRETIEKKFNIFHIMFYMVAVLLHQFVAVLFFLRILLGVLNHRNNFLKIITLIAMGVILYVGRDFLDGWFANIQDKGTTYISGKVTFSQPWGYVIGAICGLISIISIIKFDKVGSQIKKRFFAYKCFLLTCLFVAIVFSFEYTIFHRLITYVVPIIALAFLMIYLQNQRDRNVFIEKNIMLIASFGLLFISCWQGALGALQFFIF